MNVIVRWKFQNVEEGHMFLWTRSAVFFPPFTLVLLEFCVYLDESCPTYPLASQPVSRHWSKWWWKSRREKRVWCLYAFIGIYYYTPHYPLHYFVKKKNILYISFEQLRKKARRRERYASRFFQQCQRDRQTYYCTDRQTDRQTTNNSRRADWEVVGCLGDWLAG